MRISPFIIAFILTFDCAAQRMSITIIGGDDNPNETTVAINPAEPRMRVAAANTNNFYYSAAVGLWHKTTAESALGVYGDPVLHYIDNQLYYAHLSKTAGKEWGDWFDRIVVQRVYEVKPWKEKSYSVGYNNGKMQDKPWLSSDWTQGKEAGRLYVSWTEFDKYGSENPQHRSRIRFSSLGPDEDEFSPAITISDTTGDCQDGDNTPEGVTTAVGRNGTVYAAWAAFQNIYFDQSSDEGKTWGTDLIIAKQVNGWDMDMPHLSRANGMPFLAVDTLNDFLFISWADERNGMAEVWLKYSDDQGKNWSNAINLSRDSNSHSYFPNMVFDPVNGGVQVLFFDQSSSSTGLYYYPRVVGYNPSLDQAIFMDEMLTNQAIALPGERFFYGDYVDLDLQSDLRIYSFPSYNNLQSSVVLVEIKGQRPPNSAADPIPSFNACADKDSLYLSCLMATDYKLKASIKVEQNGSKQKLKIKKKFYQIKDSESILGSIPLKSEQDLILKIKYKMVHPKTKEVRKAVLSSVYP